MTGSGSGSVDEIAKLNYEEFVYLERSGSGSVGEIAKLNYEEFIYLCSPMRGINPTPRFLRNLELSQERGAVRLLHHQAQSSDCGDGGDGGGGGRRVCA